jgi:hypothetical protein
MDYDDYLQMLKMVGFTHCVSDCTNVEFFFSFGWGLIALEVTTLRSLRLLLPNGSIANLDRIFQSIPMINIAVGLPTMRAGCCSARLSLIGMTQRK